MGLAEIIKNRIRQEGPVSFHDFMEMSLYYPGEGYYTSAGEKIGERGDFYTSSYVTGLFGGMLASQLEEMWQLLGRRQFTIVECGAGTGLLCRDILSALKDRASSPARYPSEEENSLYDHLEYFIVEKSPAMRLKERAVLESEETLRDAVATGKVRWFDSIGEIPQVTGCFLSNELIDNLSVHRVVMEEELMEVFVSYNHGSGGCEGEVSGSGFVEVLRPAGKEILDYFGRLAVNLPRGFRTEVNLEAIAWIKQVADILEKGFLLTIDYGHVSAELYSSCRGSGTLSCYFRHSVSQCPYDHIGEQDITTHVNFTALQKWGEDSGLQCCGYTSQIYFLQGLGLASHLRELEQAVFSAPVGEREKIRLVQTFLMEMGTRFKVLIQQKGMQSPFISGMRLARRSC